jgi:hypothetical protein
VKNAPTLLEPKLLAYLELRLTSSKATAPISLPAEQSSNRTWEKYVVDGAQYTSTAPAAFPAVQLEKLDDCKITLAPFTCTPPLLGAEHTLNTHMEIETKIGAIMTPTTLMAPPDVESDV